MKGSQWDDSRSVPERPDATIQSLTDNGAETSLRSPLAGLESLHLIMGWQCNVRCSMCYQTDFSPRFNMVADIYGNKLRPAYPYVRSVKLTGGEPTIMKNCREAATLLRDYPHVKLTLTTNGVRVDDFWHHTFVEQSSRVSFSVNAATAATYDRIVVHGDFARVVRNIERLTSSRRNGTPTVGMSAVIIKENFHELHDVIRLGAGLGVDYVEFLIDPILSYAGLPARPDVEAELLRCHQAAARTPLRVVGLRTFQHHRAFQNEESSKGEETPGMCHVPFRRLVVGPDGSVRVCCNTWVKIGNLAESSLVDVWQSSTARRFRSMVKKGNYLWCSPTCSANPCPSRLSLLHKYWYVFNEDPAAFVRRFARKSQQLSDRKPLPLSKRPV